MGPGPHGRPPRYRAARQPGRQGGPDQRRLDIKAFGWQPGATGAAKVLMDDDVFELEFKKLIARVSVASYDCI